MRFSRRQAYIISIIIHILILPWFTHDWDVYVWREVARDWYYKGLTPYDVILTNDSRIYPVGFPYEPQWYAYPPMLFILLIIFYFPCFILSKFGLCNIILENVCVKIPMVIGDFILALAVRKIILLITKNKRKAEIGEISILLNPFIIWLSAGWGMFDALVFGIFLWAVILLHEKKIVHGSLLLAVSVLLKQTVWISVPFILVYLLRRFKLKTTIKILVYSSTFGLMILSPFLLYSFDGLLYAVLKMHANRIPAGYNIFSFITFGVMYASLQLGINPLPMLEILKAFFSFTSFLLVGVILLRLIAATFDEHSLSFDRLLDYLFYSFLVFLAFNKVTNEQYFVYPIALLFIKGITKNQEFSKFGKELSLRMLLCTLIGGLRILSFLPPYVIRFLQLNPYSFLYYTYVMGEYSMIIKVSAIIAILILIPVLSEIYRLVFEKIRQLHLLPGFILGYLTNIRYFNKALSALIRKLHQMKLSYFLVILLLFASIIKIPSALMAASSTTGSHVIKESNLLVGIYYSWIFNPSHDITQKEGSWVNAKFTPIDGYYDVNRMKLFSDFKRIRDLGANFIAIEYYPALGVRFTFVLTAAARYNLTILPCVNLSMFLMDAPASLEVKSFNGTTIKGYYALKLDTLLYFIDRINKLISITNDINLKIKNTSAIIFINVMNTRPGYSEEEKIYLANSLIELIQTTYNLTNITETFHFLSKILNTTIDDVNDLIELYPRNDSEFLSNSLIAYYWRQAFKYAWIKFWLELKNKTNNPYLIIGDWFKDNPWLELDTVFKVFNASIYLPIFIEKEFKEYILKSTLITVFPFEPGWWINKNWQNAYIYDELWNLTYNRIKTQNDDIKIVLIYAWNDYMNGEVIEPTKEFGYMVMNKTYEWISAIRGII